LAFRIRNVKIDLRRYNRYNLCDTNRNRALYLVQA